MKYSGVDLYKLERDMYTQTHLNKIHSDTYSNLK